MVAETEDVPERRPAKEKQGERNTDNNNNQSDHRDALRAGASLLFPEHSSAPAVIACTPVFKVGSGIGAKNGEWFAGGNGALPSRPAFIAAGSLPPVPE